VALSKERQVYISVLTLGLGALIADRVFVLDEGPASASAADLLVSSGAGARATAAPAAAIEGFPERLRRRAEELPGADGDAFLIPAAWLPAPRVPAPETPEASQEAPADELAGLFTLSSIAGSTDAGKQAAVLNGSLITRGDHFDLRDGKCVRARDAAKAAFVLDEVAQDSVRVRVIADGSVLTLRLRTEGIENGRIQTRARSPR
jgi:hypothetical protein